ncbi:hypothetical protein SBADM41S_01492 [Streptomyces badius]
MARRSGEDNGLTPASLSTKRRYPLSVGMRPALVCGWAMKPSSSSTAMSLRTVAGETPSRCRSVSALEPTGSSVPT